MERQNQIPDRIGLCLSGGGFRAAAFHLGTLVYLDRVKLLDKVCALSTVSGGTFTGAKFAISKADNVPAVQFFKAYYRDLKELQIFPKALEILANGQSIGTPSQRKDIITCAAQSYAETLFCENGSPILFDKILNGNTAGLDDIIFNATDFRTGFAFRFQKTATGWIGNLETHLSPSEASQIRVADIVASSSCFPAGFEPIDFPNDFHWPGGKMPAGIAAIKTKSLPLMDGGVFDNQGMQSLEMRVREKGVDMILISDTDRQAEALYTMPDSVASLVRDKDAKRIWKLLIGWNPSLNCLAWLSLFVQWSCGLSAAVIVANIWTQQTTEPRPSIIWMLLSNIVPLGLTIITLVLTTLIRSIFKNKLLARVPQLKTAGWKYLKKVNLVGLVDMISLRASSLMTLVSDVFMKRIRSGSYRSIYGDPDYQDKLAANLIYSIQNPWPFDDPATDEKMLPGVNVAFEAQLKSIRTPSDELLKVAKTAAEIATLLWFEDDKQLPTLVASGQATTCLNLMKFVARTRTLSADGRFADPAVQALWDQLRADWDQFRVNPDFLTTL